MVAFAPPPQQPVLLGESLTLQHVVGFDTGVIAEMGWSFFYAVVVDRAAILIVNRDSCDSICTLRCSTVIVIVMLCKAIVNTIIIVT